MTLLKPVRYARATMLALSMLWAATAACYQGYPDSVEAYDPREVALLPSFCKHTTPFQKRVPGGDDPEQIRRLSQMMGHTFTALHHYCWGLMHTNRALYLGLSPMYRRSHLTQSISEFNYVLNHAIPGFVLLPEILTKKGENLLRLGRAPEGLQSLQQAIAAKPDYWPPYVALSDYYKGSGDRAKARETLEQAIALSPNVKTLRARMAELDGAGDKRKAGSQPAAQPGKPPAAPKSGQAEARTGNPQPVQPEPETPAER